MKQFDSRIRKHQVRFETIRADQSDLTNIVDDMMKFGGKLKPASIWLTLDAQTPFEAATKEIVTESYSPRHLEGTMSTMEKVLARWIGGALLTVDQTGIKPWKELLADNDPLELWKVNVEKNSETLIADLWSIMDIDLIWSFRSVRKPFTRVLEIGGGYGRLAEAMLNVFETSISYVVVDAVPVSLYYAKEYLSRACPEMRIGSYYDNDPFDLDKFSCYIVPVWHFERLNRYSYDICINVESFQEMLQEHVDFYLQLFDKITVDEALFYISNAHDYYFKGQWNYPKHWRKLFCSTTPRAWTRDNRTEALIKTNLDYSVQNQIMDELYEYELSQHAQLASQTSPQGKALLSLRRKAGSLLEYLRKGK